MSHLHQKPGQHDITVSAYITRLDEAEPTLLLHKHRVLGKYLHLGGHVELDENPWQAVTREIAEESGYNISQLKVLQPALRLTRLSHVILHPYPVVLLTHKFGQLDHYHIDITYAFVTHEPPTGTINKGESADIRTFTQKELAALPADDIPEDVREIGLFVLGECLANWTAVDTSEFSG